MNEDTTKELFEVCPCCLDEEIHYDSEHCDFYCKGCSRHFLIPSKVDEENNIIEEGE